VYIFVTTGEHRFYVLLVAGPAHIGKRCNALPRDSSTIFKGSWVSQTVMTDCQISRQRGASKWTCLRGANLVFPLA